MKSVSVEEIEQVQADTFEQFVKLFPALMHKPNPSNAEEIKSYFLAKEELTIHMVRILSHYRLFVDRLNKSNDFEAFSEELFMRQLETYKSKLAEKDNGDFNEIK